MKTCLICKKELPSHRSKYCSDEHSYLAYKLRYRKKPKLKNCFYCGEVMVYINSQRKFCSRACSINSLHHDRNVKKRQKYVDFLREYLKDKVYFKSSQVARAYIEKYEYEKWNDLNYKPYYKKITLKFSGIMRTLTKEGYTKAYNHSNNPAKVRLYKISDKLFEGLDDMTNGKKMMTFKRSGLEIKDFDNNTQEWRRFNELHKTDIYKATSGKEDGKLHFLGTIDKVDSIFREIWDSI